MGERAVSVDGDMFKGFLWSLAVSVLHIKLFITSCKSANSPGTALSLILGLVVVDSKLLCHLFFACFYFPFFSFFTSLLLSPTKPFSA